MSTTAWEKTFKSKLEALLVETFNEENSLSDELKTYAIKHHLIEDITSFVQNEENILRRKIAKCSNSSDGSSAKDLQGKINEIIACKNFFYIGSLKGISYDLWTAAPPADNIKWQTYTKRHQGGEKQQTFYAHVSENLHCTTTSLIQSNVGQMFCLNDASKLTMNGNNNNNNSTKRDKGIIYVLEYRQHSYNISIVGDCLLNGVKANHLHDIHKSDVVVYPRATTGDILKSYLKQIIRQNADVVIVHVGTYDITIGNQDTLKNLKAFTDRIKEKCPDTIIAFSSVLTRVDRKGVKAAVKNLNAQLKVFCKEQDVAFINNDNVNEECLCQKMLLTLNNKGRAMLSENLSDYINSLI